MIKYPKNLWDLGYRAIDRDTYSTDTDTVKKADDALQKLLRHEMPIEELKYWQIGIKNGRC